MHSQDLAPAPGALFDGRYEILAKLGAGGFGTVLKARQRTTGQLVALKIMRLPEHGGAARADTRAARFLREARLCARLHHPNIVQIVDAGQTGDGSLYTAFAFAPGDNLADLLAKEGALPLREALHLMMGVLDALACAHAQGVVHRDIKPSNIMVIPTGARRNALVLDFGIGAILDIGRDTALADPFDVDRDAARLTGSQDTLGTPGYGAPEQWRGIEPSPRADLFSWGLVLLECLTGNPIYTGSTAAEIFYHLLGPDPVPIPSALERHPLGDILRSATQKDVAARDVTARGLLDAIEACDVRGLPREARLGAGEPDRGTPSLLSIDTGAAPHAIAGERRQLTAICCHARALAAAPGDTDTEALDDALRAGLGACAGVVHSHRGRVAAVLGDDLLAYFGYPQAAEDDARRAARAALAIAGAIAVENERLAARGIRIEGRVGLHTGLVVAGDLPGLRDAGLVAGSTPRLAERLAALAQPGSVAITAATQALLRADFDMEAQATRSIEGLAAPVEVFRLLRERDAQTPGPTPDGAKTPLVGRQQELDLLLERWRRVLGGAGQASLLTGEPGIGKSRLARELRDRLANEAHLFIEGRCSPDTQNNALFPVVDLLGRALGLDQDPEPGGKTARLEAQLADHGFTPAEAMPLFLPLFSLPIGEPFAPLPVSPQRQKALTLGAVVSLLLGMAEKRPLLLLVEDLHWADPTTLELLDQLVREVPSTAMCLLLTARPEFSPSFSTTGMLQLPLGRLERSQIEAMLAELTGEKALPAGAIEQVVNRTDGVPLFIEELTRMMVESGVLVEREDCYELSGALSDAEIPGTLRALLTARLDRLGRAKETAQVAAALGREFSIEVLSAVSPLGAAAVQEDLDRLMSAGLVLRKRRWKDPVGVFKHALVRDAAYESLARGARRQAHARIAGTLEARFPEIVRTRPDLLAHHHAAAEQKRQAVGYAQQAAQQGLERSAYAEAIAHASNVVDWADALAASERVEMELVANGVLSQAMMPFRGWADPQVKAAVDRSAQLLSQLDRFSPHRVPTLWSLFAYHHTASNRAEARAVAEEVVSVAEASGDQGLRAAATTILGCTLHPEGNLAGSRDALERAIALYDPEAHRDHGVRIGLDTLVLARALLAHLRWFAGDTAAAFELVMAALEWAREIGHVPSLALGLLYGCQVYQFSGDKETVAAMTGEILGLAAKYGLPAYEGYAALIHAWATGDEQGAEAILGALGGMGCKLCLTYYGSLLAENLAERGCLREAIARVDHCLSLCRENDEHYFEPELHRRRAVYLLQDDPGEASARASLEQAVRLARHQGMQRIEALATEELHRRFSSDPRLTTDSDSRDVHGYLFTKEQYNE